MQRHCTELTERLLNSLDKEYNVIDMGGVVDVITILEKTTITKEVLEITRLGKHINELRRKTSNNALAKRAKELVRRWRETCLPSAQSTPQPTPADTAPTALNGAKPHSPALRGFKPHSPAVKALRPESPLLKDIVTPLRVISPALSLVHSEHSRSPNASAMKQSITATSNHHRGLTPDINSALVEGENHQTEAVPRTHSANKRLRKEDINKEQRHHRHHQQQQQQQSLQQQQQQQREAGTTPSIDSESLAKRQRLNGENISGNLISQVPSPTYKERISDYYLESSESADGAEPKKRGRKKGSKSARKQPLLEDRVKEKLASISRNPKLKTTQELLADLQARGSSCSVAPPSQSVEPPSMDVVLRGSDGSHGKFLRTSSTSAAITRNSNITSETHDSLSKKRKDATNVVASRQTARTKEQQQRQEHKDEKEVVVVEDEEEETIVIAPRQLTVEEILAKLPPLDVNAIEWSDAGDDDDDGDNDEKSSKRNNRDFPPRDITDVDLDRLHTQFVEGLNGNFQPKLSSLTPVEKDKNSDLNGVDDAFSQNEQEFREWHEMLARPTVDGQILHILPYVIID